MPLFKSFVAILISFPSDIVRQFNELVGTILNHKGPELLVTHKQNMDALISQIANLIAIQAS
jgi:hypothetical protein